MGFEDRKQWLKELRFLRSGWQTTQLTAKVVESSIPIE